MHCEICDAISRLNLSPHAHASYECATGQSKSAVYFTDLKLRVERGELPSMVIHIGKQRIRAMRKAA
jgi:hypothetical protein